jgi:hypothetical protein
MALSPLRSQIPPTIFDFVGTGEDGGALQASLTVRSWSNFHTSHDASLISAISLRTVGAVVERYRKDVYSVVL